MGVLKLALNICEISVKLRGKNMKKQKLKK